MLLNLLPLLKRKQLGNQFLNELGMRISQSVDQALGLLTRKQQVRILFHDLSRMCGQSGDVIDPHINGAAIAWTCTSGVIRMRASFPVAQSSLSADKSRTLVFGR